jgi:putative acetyltransferase
MMIRAEASGDYRAVHAIMLEAFKSDAEAKLVAALRLEADPLIALVAEEDNTIIGHLTMSPVVLPNQHGYRLMGLAPMAVTTRRRGEGIGSGLVHAGLDQCRQLEYGAVVVLGHPGYYPRFGFIPARKFGLACEYDVPDEAFMALELQAGYLANAWGTVRYHPAFQAL